MRRAEFDVAYEEYKEVILQVATLYTHNRYTAEDIVQEAFLRYYIYIGHTRVKDTKAWLLTTIKNMALNGIKTNRKETVIDVREQPEDLFGSEDSAENEFFEDLWKLDSRKMVNIILEGLREKNKKWFEAFTFVYCMGMLNKEAAKRMGISDDALQSILYRAKKWIKENYAGEYARIRKK